MFVIFKICAWGKMFKITKTGLERGLLCGSFPSLLMPECPVRVPSVQNEQERLWKLLEVVLLHAEKCITDEESWA